MKRAEMMAVGGVVLLLVYVGWKVKKAGSAISEAAGTGWTLINVPPLDPSMPGASIGNAIVAAPANTLDALSFGTVGGTTSGASSVYDAMKAGPLGGLVGILSGDGNTNILGPAPSSGLDFGKGADDWSN